MVRAGDVIRASDIAVQACRVTRNAAQSIGSAGAFTIVNFDAELFDTDAMHSTSTNNSRVTINTAGIYIATFTGSFEIAANYTRVMSQILLNGTTELARAGYTSTTANVSQLLDVTTVYQLDAGDYLEAGVAQSSSGSKNLEVVADRSPQFAVARIGS